MGVSRDSVALRSRDDELAALIYRMADGDEAAVNELYDSTSRLVFGLVLRILGDRGAAEEVSLDVYTQSWRQAATYDRKRGAPLAWLTTIARSRAIDRLRSAKHDQSKESIETAGPLSADGVSPEDAAVNSERRRIVRMALNSLTPEQRQVIELAYYGGLSHTEIAAKLNQPLGTVKTRTRLGLIKLRESLRPLLAEG